MQGAERRLAKLEGGADEAAEREGDGSGLGGDPMLTSVLLKEISRVSPGFGMVLIATARLRHGDSLAGLRRR